MKEYPNRKMAQVPTPAFKEIDPEKKRRSKKQLWCPYEGEWRLFKGEQRTGYITEPKCQGCGISTEDFWVKTANKLWGMGLKPQTKKR